MLKTRSSPISQNEWQVYGHFEITSEQSSHLSGSTLGSKLLCNLHIRPLPLMILQASQSWIMKSLYCILPLAREAAIPFVRFMISSSFSKSMARPLIFLPYKLTADWLTPRRLATSNCLNLYLLISSFATIALTAGRTHFTATSHGANKA